MNQEEKQVLSHILNQGEYFVKHHRFSTPKLRFIYLENDNLYWCKPEEKSTRDSKNLGFISLKEVTLITHGLVKGLRISDNSRLENIFTIQTNKRTLELEAKSNREKIIWMNGLMSILKK